MLTKIKMIGIFFLFQLKKPTFVKFKYAAHIIKYTYGSK